MNAQPASAALSVVRPMPGAAVMPPGNDSAFDLRGYRSALGHFPTGVTIMTAVDIDGRQIGMTVNSFASVSLDPAIILWSIVRTTPSYLAFSRATYFAVNVLAEEQCDLSTRFSRASPDKFAGVACERGIGGVPLIEGCAARFECSLRERHVAGDHDIILGNVERFSHSERKPLAFALSGYRRIADMSA